MARRRTSGAALHPVAASDHSRSAFVAGASGFVGRRLVCHLRSTGWRIATARLRPGQAMALPNAGDVVFHLAGIAHQRRHALPALMAANCDLALDLYHGASEAGAAGFVFLSTAKVLGERSDRPLSVDAPRQPVGPYAMSKAAAEQELFAAHRRRRLPLAIVRPPLVYGPGVKANFRTLLAALSLGLPLPLADAEALRSFVAVDNLVDALGLIGARLAAGEVRIWHVADDRDIDVATLCRTIAAHLHRDARLWRLPPAVLHFARRGPGASIFEQFRLDASALVESLGWVAPKSQSAAFGETVRWWTTRRGAARVLQPSAKGKTSR